MECCVERLSFCLLRLGGTGLHTVKKSAGSALGEQFLDCLAVAVDGGIEGPAFDFKSGLGADPHGGENGGVEVTDRDRIFDRD